MGSGAITSWLLYFSADDAMREILFWMMGSLSYGQVLPLGWWVPYLLGMLWLLCQRRSLKFCCNWARVSGPVDGARSW